MNLSSCDDFNFLWWIQQNVSDLTILTSDFRGTSCDHDSYCMYVVASPVYGEILLQ